MIRCVVWDWNGTLLNDVEVAFSAMNQMLSRRGLPRLESLSAYREIFTFPVRDYYEAAGLDLERESFSELAVEWTQLYNRFYPSCGLFPKAAEILKAVQGMGLRQLLVSASQQEALDRQVEEQGLTGCFEAQLGISNIYAGSKAGLAQAYFQRQGICPQEAVFLGDTLHDWQVAEEAGCLCALLSQGHQSRSLLETAGVPVLDRLEEVLPLLGGSQRGERK